MGCFRAIFPVSYSSQTLHSQCKSIHLHFRSSLLVRELFKVLQNRPKRYTQWLKHHSCRSRIHPLISKRKSCQKKDMHHLKNAAEQICFYMFFFAAFLPPFGGIMHRMLIFPTISTHFDGFRVDRSSLVMRSSRNKKPYKTNGFSTFPSSDEERF